MSYVSYITTTKSRLTRQTELCHGTVISPYAVCFVAGVQRTRGGEAASAHCACLQRTDRDKARRSSTTARSSA